MKFGTQMVPDSSSGYSLGIETYVDTAGRSSSKILTNTLLTKTKDKLLS